MELQSPFAIITPTVDGDALAVLARADDEFTAPQVQRLIGAHSVEGVRRALVRLSEQGIVEARRPSRTIYYRLNRAHLGAEAVVALAGLRSRLIGRLRERIAAWDPRPELAALFGSAATGTMRPDSDIDVFVVRPPGVDADHEGWRNQLELLTDDVAAWTGNDVRVLEYGADEVVAARRDGDVVLDDIATVGIALHGQLTYLRR
jgi:predicted nucleotidyltransferase